MREFARAVGATHPAHHDVAAARALGHPDVIAPPTFAVVIAQRAEAQLIEDPAPGSTSPAWSTPTSGSPTTARSVAGDELITVLHVDSITRAAGLSMIRPAARSSDDDGEPVATVVATLAVRGEDA